MLYGNLVIAAFAGVALAGTSPYVPQNASCPSNANFVRAANSLSDGEQSFLKKRQSVTRQALIDWLSKSNMQDFDPSSFLSNQTIPVGLAFSGGGYRAMLSGAGMLAALDNRTDGSTQNGHMGGLLQASTYLVGLSGGNWLVGSIVVNNYTSVQALQGDSDLWNIKHSLINPGGIDIFETADYWTTISDDVDDKGDAGFNTSLTDLWGRGLGYQMFNASKGGQNLSYVAIRDYDAFQNGEMPFPIHVTDRRAIGEKIINLNSTVFEFNPYELGSWDPNVYSFTDLKYIGSNVDNGKPTGNECVTGFDNVGFMIGTSATLFNQFLLQLNSTGISGEIYKIAHHILNDLGKDGDDIAIYDPNPFKGVAASSNSKDSILTLVDGGEDNENIPLYPLIQPQRNVDVVFAFDNSADTSESWPDGASMVATYERQFADQANGTIFPYVPDNNTFVYGGYTEQPGFFGCNRTNLTSLFNSSLPESERFYPPVIVYVANSNHSYASNESTFKLSYETDEVGGMIENGYNIMTQNNGTLDSEWRTCVACAIVLREQQRRGQSPTQQCQKCFSKYCWDGKTVDSGSAKRRDNQTNSVADNANSSAAASSASASASASASSTHKKKNDAVSPAVGTSVLSLALVSIAAMFL